MQVSPSYVRVQWLFWKVLGGIYAIAFLSLAVQIRGLIGSKGILPAGVYLTRISEATGPGRYWNLPAVFWLNASDLALALVCIAGAICSVLLMLGFAQRIALILCYALYLSLVTAGQDFLSFQWDILLLESGFLAIFLGFSPLIVWMFRWLLFRLMLLSGAVKLLSGDVTWRTLAALRFHYYTQPLPTPLAWYMQQLPAWFQEASVAVMFAIELGAPFLIFTTRRLRFFGGLCIVFLQALILLTGNYTFFNLLTIALCIPLLDDAALAGVARRLVSAAPGFLRNVLAACEARQKAGLPSRGAGRHQARARATIAFAAAAILILISGSQLLAEFFGFMPAPLRFVQRVASPFYLANTYGLFAVMTTERHEIIVQGSNDGSQWRDYEFKYKPGDVNRAPRWIAPYQPRLDWQMWFAALGNYRNNPWFVNFVYRLLEGSPQVLGLLARDPFSHAPPRYIRALSYSYTFTDFQTRRATGAWWRREAEETHLPAVSLRDFRTPE